MYAAQYPDIVKAAPIKTLRRLEKMGLLPEDVSCVGEFERKFEQQVLQREGIKISDFKNMLQETGSMLSGSVIHMISGDFENVIYSFDIDIFTTVEQMDKIKDFLYEQIDCVCELPNEFFRYLTPGQFTVCNLLTAHHKFQIIGHKTSTSAICFQDVVNDFDLDICRNWYDGQSLHLSNSFMQGYETLTELPRRAKTLERIFKYAARGYAFVLFPGTCTDIAGLSNFLEHFASLPYKARVNLAPLVVSAIHNFLKLGQKTYMFRQDQFSRFKSIVLGKTEYFQNQIDDDSCVAKKLLKKYQDECAKIKYIL
ncbi:hypothetical protein BCR44DRAFT_23427 [Catenaria anguillulae PL171]|uniref:Uncharacterized protein n=1 Tax=Catenaria anguillulae PL171 TaxID=765915 RepID=A0A1Y2GFQ2_9FUNG|nr:hypothetical protein BCR44DRAFT_23427 [Catenaria anguillulae PL171]